jgi:hypothetical protein
MKVLIKPYPSFIGPYQIAEKILFWKDPYDDTVMALGEFLSGGEEEDSLLLKVCQKIYNYRVSCPRAFVHIDPYDTWSMDDTLAHIILPMLKQIKKEKHGSPFVDDNDVPDELKSTSCTEDKDDTWRASDCNIHKRWDYVLDEMIWAFEYKLLEDDDYNIEHNNRMANGFRLFGTYYQGLWD